MTAAVASTSYAPYPSVAQRGEKKERQKRSTPCVPCRSIRVKCEWPPGSQTCTRCLDHPHLTCSGPVKKSIPPCELCIKAKVKCVWLPGDSSCAKCTSRNKRCPGDPRIPKTGSATPPMGSGGSSGGESPDGAVSTPPSSDEEFRQPLELYRKQHQQLNYPPLHLASSRVAEVVNLQWFDVHLANEGRTKLLTIEHQAILEASSLTRGKNAPLTIVDEITTLLYMVSGWKFSSHEVVIGSSLPATLPDLANLESNIPTADLSICGVQREQGLQSLTDKVWDRLRRLDASNLSEEPAEVAKLAATIRMAAKICRLPNEIADHIEARRILAWGTQRVVKALERDDCTDEETSVLLTSAVQLAVREAFESLIVAQPSLIPRNVYKTACQLPDAAISLRKLTPADFDPIFASTEELSLPERRIIVNDLIMPGSLTAFSLMSDIARDVMNDMEMSLPYWWQVIDRVVQFHDEITGLLLADSRNSPATKERMWTVLRSILTAEQCISEVDVLICSVVEKKLAWTPIVSPHLSALVLESRRRLTVLLQRTARRLALALGYSKRIFEIFDILDAMVLSSHDLGPQLGVAFQGLQPEEQAWILRGFGLAAFFDPTAGKRIAELEIWLNVRPLDEDFSLPYDFPAHDDPTEQEIQQALFGNLSAF